MTTEYRIVDINNYVINVNSAFHTVRYSVHASDECRRTNRPVWLMLVIVSYSPIYCWLTSSLTASRRQRRNAEYCCSLGNRRCNLYDVFISNCRPVTLISSARLPAAIFEARQFTWAPTANEHLQVVRQLQFGTVVHGMGLGQLSIQTISKNNESGAENTWRKLLTV